MFNRAAPDQAAKMDADNFRSKMNSIAYGSVMAKAAEDLKQEMLETERAGASRGTQQLDISDLADDPELEKLHRDRLEELRREAEMRAVLQRRGHGEYQDVKESDFLDTVTQTRQVVCHFWHRDFVRCKIVDKHLQQLAIAYFGTRFIKVSAAEAPFFTEKLQIRVLPCVICFLDGIAMERLVGFDVFGNRDDFTTGEMCEWLIKCGAITPKANPQNVLPEHFRTTVRSSRPDPEDEDSDFSD